MFSELKGGLTDRAPLLFLLLQPPLFPYFYFGLLFRAGFKDIWNFYAALQKEYILFLLCPPEAASKRSRNVENIRSSQLKPNATHSQYTSAYLINDTDQYLPSKNLFFCNLLSKNKIYVRIPLLRDAPFPTQSNIEFRRNGTTTKLQTTFPYPAEENLRIN